MRFLLPQVLLWLLSVSSTLALTSPRDANATEEPSEKHAFIENLVAQMTVPEMGVWSSCRSIHPKLIYNSNAALSVFRGRRCRPGI